MIIIDIPEGLKSDKNENMKILLDTNVLFSALGRFTDTSNRLKKVAESVIQKCSDKGFEMCISERTKREFEKGWKEDSINSSRVLCEKEFTNCFTMLPYHYGNETWDKIDGHWENIGSLWNNEIESSIADEIEALLPSSRNRHDRGILLDAIQNKCDVVISENWSDFRRIKDIGLDYGVAVYKPEDFIDLE